MLIQKAENGKYVLEIHLDEDPLNPREEQDNLGTMVCWHNRYALGDKRSKGDPEDFIVALAEEMWQNAPVSHYAGLIEAVQEILKEEEQEHLKDAEFWYPESLIAELATENPDKLQELVFQDPNLVILPLNLYDHSGISMSTGRQYPFDCPWDSGQVGWIYLTKKRFLQETGHGSDQWPDKAEEILEAEVKEYNYFLTGQVFGFVLDKKTPCETCGTVELETLDSCWGFAGDHCEEDIKGHLDPEFHYLLDELEEVY